MAAAAQSKPWPRCEMIVTTPPNKLAPANEMKSARRFLIVLRILASVSAVMTLIGVCYLPTCHHRNNSGAWPTTTGVVRDAALKTTFQKPGTTPRYSPLICYSYTVDGIPRASTRIDFGDPVRQIKEEALAWVNLNYPVGKQVTVHYDSKNPDLAVLVPGAKDLLLFGWSFAGTAAFCCVASLLFLLRQHKQMGVLK